MANCDDLNNYEYLMINHILIVDFLAKEIEKFSGDSVKEIKVYADLYAAQELRFMSDDDVENTLKLMNRYLDRVQIVRKARVIVPDN